MKLAGLVLIAALTAALAPAADRLEVHREHPRVFLCPANLADYRARVPNHPGWPAFRERAEKGSLLEAAFAWQITRDPRFAALAAKALADAVAKPKADPKSLALAFDWTFDQLPEPLRRACIARLAAAAGLDAWTPPTKFRPGWTFHSESWCGREPVEHYALAALAHHHPNAEAAYRALWETAGLKDARDLLRYLADGSWPEGGYWIVRAKAALLLKTFLVLRTATNLDEFAASPYLNRIGHFILYQSDPWCRRLWTPFGDAFYPPLTTWQHRDIMLLAASQAKNPYYQWLLAEGCGYKPGNALDDLLFYDPSLASKPPGEGLPPSRLFTGMNLAVMRSDWSPDALAVALVNKDYFDCHVHFDNGSFILYKAGATHVPDTGLYSGFGDPHYANYLIRTVAHNTLLVDDPSEQIRYYGHQADPAAERDGGQRFPGRAHTFARFIERRAETDLGDIVAWHDHPLFTCVAADASRAYSGETLREFTRTLLLLRPGAVVIFDRVETADPAFKKRWLMHLEGEPRIDGQMADWEVKGHIETFDGGLTTAVHPANGHVLQCLTLLPARHRIKRIGGTPEAEGWPSASLRRGSFAAKDATSVGPPLYLEGPNPLARTPRDEAVIRLMWGHSAPSSIEVAVDGAGLAVSHAGCLRLGILPGAFRIAFADAPTLGALVAALNKALAATRWHAQLIAGYAFWNGGRNYPPQDNALAGEYARAMADKPKLADALSIGRWRIEVSPAEPAARDCFLHLIVVRDKPGEPPPAATVDDGAAAAALEFRDGSRHYRVAFAKAGPPVCRLAIADEAGKTLFEGELPATVDLSRQP